MTRLPLHHTLGIGIVTGTTLAMMGLTYSQAIIVLVYLGVHRARKRQRRH